MSLSPVIGTEVPETANGVVTPISSENGPHVLVSVKCGGSRVPSPGEAEDRALGHTENHVHVENRVYDGEGGLDTEIYNNERISNLSSYTSQVTDPSLPAATCTGDSESGSKDTDISEASNTAKPPGAALLWDSAQQARSDSSQRGGPATTYRQQMEAETVVGGTDSQEEEEEEEDDDDDEEEDGEKEKQDEEDDEKNEKKCRNEHSGGRTEVEVSQL